MFQFTNQQRCPSCGRCAPLGPCPCTVDDFSTDTLSSYTETGGPFSINGSDQLVTSSAGTLTKTLKLPDTARETGVEADVFNVSHQLFGIVIGEGQNKIEWLWDVAGTQVTLQVTSGGVVTVDNDYAGAPATSLGLFLKQNSCNDWDIRVTRDGVDVATLVAVTVEFEEDRQQFGVVAYTGGGTWDNLCLRTCEAKPPCAIGPAGDCGAIFPIAYSLTISVAANPNYNGAETGVELCPDGNSCPSLNGTWLLLHGSRARQDILTCAGDAAHFQIRNEEYGEPQVYYSAYSSGTIDTLSRPATPLGCTVDPWCFPDPNNTPSVPSIVTGDTGTPLASVITGRCICDESVVSPYPISPQGNTVRTDFEGSILPMWQLIMSCGEDPFIPPGIELQAIPPSAFPFNVVERYEAAFPGGANPDLRTVGPIVLDRATINVPIDNSGDRPCDTPLTATITPISTQSELEAVLGGSNGCIPAEGTCNQVFSEEGTVFVSATLNGEHIEGCLNGPAGTSTGPFQGTLFPLPDAEGNINPCHVVTVLIECRRICAHQYEWIMVMDWINGAGSSITIEDNLGPDFNLQEMTGFGGQFTGSCETMPEPPIVDPIITGMFQDITSAATADDPFPCFCPDMPPCPVSAISVQGQLQCPPGESGSLNPSALNLTNSTLPGSPTGYTPGDMVYFGVMPDDGVSFHDMAIYCDGTNLRFVVYELDGTTIKQQGTLNQFDCESLSGYFNTNFAYGTCNLGGQGVPTICINGGCP